MNDATSGAHAVAATPRVFDPEDLNSRGFGAKLAARILARPQWLFGILRRFAPVVQFRGFAFIFRYDDVVDALKADAELKVPFGPKVEALNGGPNFLLGMADGPDYRRLRTQVADLFTQKDNEEIIAPLAAEAAKAIVAKGQVRLDAIEDLVIRVPIEICIRHYGVDVPDVRAFGQWTVAMSTYMFGDPLDNPKVKRCALAAGDALRVIVDAAIAKAKAGGSPGTVAERLVQAQAKDPTLTDEVARSILIGMITGFVPTNTMAGGHMLEMLLQRPDFLAHAQAAALDGDDERLKGCLFEAFRFKPLNPGPFRECGSEYVVAPGTRRETRLKPGTKVLVSTQSAMFDPQRVVKPKAFDPSRPPSEQFYFGFGLHWCIGAKLAEAQITQTFKPLLLRPGLRRAAGHAGTLRRLGPFPAHLEVVYN